MLGPSSCSGFWHRQNINLIFHKAPQKEVEGCHFWRLRSGSGPYWLNHSWDNCLLKNVICWWMYGGTPSCWKTFSLSSSRRGINHNFNVSWQIIPLTIQEELNANLMCVGQQVEHILNCMSIKKFSVAIYNSVPRCYHCELTIETGYCTTYSNPWRLL